MVNNATHINKMYNNFSPQLIEHKKKIPRQMVLEIQFLVWNRHKNVAGLCIQFLNYFSCISCIYKMCIDHTCMLD